MKVISLPFSPAPLAFSFYLFLSLFQGRDFLLRVRMEGLVCRLLLHAYLHHRARHSARVPPGCSLLNLFCQVTYSNTVIHLLTETVQEVAGAVQVQVEPLQRVWPAGLLHINLASVGRRRDDARWIFQAVFVDLEGLPRPSDELPAQALLHHPIGLLPSHVARALLPES